MKTLLKFITGAVALGSATLCSITPASAQQSSALALTTCGSVSYRSGSIQLNTQTTTGLGCFQVTPAPGSVQDVNVSKINGSTTNVGIGASGAGTQRVVTATDSTIASITNPLPAGNNFIGAVGSIFTVPSSNFTRPNNTTAYTSGNLVANSVTAGSVVPLSWVVTRKDPGTSWVFKATLTSTNTALVNSVFALHLYATSPTVANGDGGAWSTSSSGWICDITVIMNATAFTDVVAGQGVPNSSNACMVSLSGSQTIYGLIEARAGFTPTASSVWTSYLEVQEN